MKPPIILCHPFMKMSPRHEENYVEFYAENKVKHNLARVSTYWRALHRAQDAAVGQAFRQGASHILFWEDDQWRVPMDALDVLLEADKEVVSFNTYQRTAPFDSMAMRKENPRVSMILPGDEMKAKKARLISFFRKRGEPVIQKADLVTFGFTLVKISVFEKMRDAWGNLLVSQQDLKALIDGDEATKERLREYTEKPMGLQPFRQWGPHPTDSFFCQYCEDLGIDRWVHFGYTIGHGDVGPNDIQIHRRLEQAKLREANARRRGFSPRLIEDDFGNVYGEDAEFDEEASPEAPVEANGRPAPDHVPLHG